MGFFPLTNYNPLWSQKAKRRTLSHGCGTKYYLPLWLPANKQNALSPINTLGKILSGRKGTFQRKAKTPPAFTVFLQSRNSGWLPRGYKFPVCSDLLGIEPAQKALHSPEELGLRRCVFLLMVQLLTANNWCMPATVVNTPQILTHWIPQHPYVVFTTIPI